MELSPEALRDARFTERFRGYDAAEVDAFLSEAAQALEELVAERSEPMAALAAERARLAIEEVRQQTLEEVAALQTRRDELANAIADLQSMLADRRRGLVEALTFIDAAGEPSTGAGDGAAPEDLPDAERSDNADAGGGDESDAERGDDAGVTDSFLVRLERAAAESGGSPG